MDNPKNWMHNTNIYEVNLRQYTQEGTFLAFLKELPRLKRMGIKTLWMMPITPISQENKKGSLGSPYAASDYTIANPEFGSKEDFRKLVIEAHRLGMKVIIDWVANHTGWDHVWTKSNPEFYKKTEEGDFLMASGMEDIIELDYNNLEMRGKMISAMKMWVKETYIDGFRCDLASWVPLDFWEEASKELSILKPLFFLGEYDELEHPDYGKVFHASYAWKWMHASENYYKNKGSIEELKNLLREYSNLGDHSMRAWFTSNHDENSWNGTEYEKYGNIALPLAVFSITFNGVPLIYSGQELPNLRRLEFFEKDAIQWKSDYELAPFYKTLLHLKLTNPALRGADPTVSTTFINTTADDKIFAYKRKKDNDEVLVILNLSDKEVYFKITDEISGIFQDIFNFKKRDFNQDKEFHFSVSDFKVYERII